MSRLDELIAELCPDGVEYKNLEEIASINRGVRVVRSQLSAEGGYPVYQNSLTPLGYYEQSNCPENTPFVISAGAAGDIGFSTIPFWAADDCLHIQGGKCADNRFLFHVLLWLQSSIYSRVRKASIPRLSRTVIERLRVPVPPLEVQREIVRVLDNFTFLSAELSAELSARRKQYEYYRNQLLTFDNETKKMSLSDVADLFRGEYITQKGSKPGNIPVILGGQEPAYYIDKANHEGEIVVIARSGVSAGFVSYWNQPIYVTDGFGYEAKKEVATPKYLYYALKRKEPALNVMKRGAGVPHVSGEMLGKVELSIPSIAVQERLVNVMDNFEAICSDLSIGLPAEIEARQKQYEYYRDLLLTFAETGGTLVTDGRQGKLK